MDRKGSLVLTPKGVWMFSIHALARYQRSKLDNKSKPCIFFEYSEDEFGYRFWDFVNKKVVRSWDVVFLEDKTIED